MAIWIDGAVKATNKNQRLTWKSFCHVITLRQWVQQEGPYHSDGSGLKASHKSGFSRSWPNITRAGPRVKLNEVNFGKSEMG
jgi:hypothetical protein